jgi:hypothetical protein
MIVEIESEGVITLSKVGTPILASVKNADAAVPAILLAEARVHQEIRLIADFNFVTTLQ